jgi:hypothetical protein
LQSQGRATGLLSFHAGINVERNRYLMYHFTTESCYVFADQYPLNLLDEQHSEDEDRWITLG